MMYPYRVYQTRVEDHVFWIAECTVLKGCVGQGDTLEAAVSELATNEMEWLDIAKEYGIEIPSIPIDTVPEYSGKLTLRVAPYVHQEAAKNAKTQGISLNQYINDAIVTHNAKMQTVEYVLPQIKQAIAQFREMFVPTTTYTSKVSSFRLNSRDLENRTYKIGNGMVENVQPSFALNH